MNGSEFQIGIISDTHSYFDPQLNHIFEGCKEIWHAGDIGDYSIIDNLEKIAPVRAVFGNIDDPLIQQRLPEDLRFTLENIKIYITHIASKPPKYNKRVLKNIQQFNPDLLICGHSHILKVMPDKSNNLLFINPGAAGQQGFHQMRTVLKLKIKNHQPADMEVVELGKRGRIKIQ